MSTILDALKRVEEQIRNEAEQRAAAGSLVGPDLSKARNDAPIPAKGAAPGENDDVMEVYTRIVGMLTRIQDQVRTAADEGKAEAKRTYAELAKSLAALQNDFARQTEAIRKEFQKRDTERDAGNARLTAMQSQSEALSRTLAETKAGTGELGQAMAVVKSEFARQMESVQKETQKRDRERDAGNAALAAMQSQSDALKKVLAETKAGTGELAQSIAAVKAGFTREMEAIHKDLQKRDRERESANAALAAMQSQADGLKKMLAQAANGADEKLAQAMSVLQNDVVRLTEAVRKESQKRDVERDAGTAGLAKAQSQTEAMQKTLVMANGANEQLAQSVAALQNDFARLTEAVRKEFQKRDGEHEAGGAALATAQSQTCALKEKQAETGDAVADLARAVTSQQNDLSLQKELIQKGLQRQEADREAARARLAESQSQIDAVKKILAGTGEANAELTQAVIVLQDDFTRQREAIKAELMRLNAEREAVNAKLALSQLEDDALKKLLAGTGAGHAELAQTVAALQNDLARQTEATQAGFRRLTVEHEAVNAKLAASQSENDALKKLLAGTGVSNAELAQAVTALQTELTGQKEATQAEFQKLIAEQEAANARLMAAQSENDALKKLLAGTGAGNAELAQVVTALQTDLARQTEVIQVGFRKRDAEREAVDAKLAESESQAGVLKETLNGTKEAHANLSQTLTTLQNELARQTEMIQAEFQKRDAEGEAGKAALASMQSQTDAVKQLLVDRERAVTDALGGGFFTAGADADAAVRQEPFPAVGVASGGDSKPTVRVDKDEAVRLHSSARDAYARGDLSEALHLLGIIDAAFPRNKSVLYNRAQCLIGLGRNDEARRLCDFLGTTLNYPPAEELKRQIRD